MDKDIWNGKWLEAKGELLNQWGKVIGDDLDRVKGNLTALAGLIEQKYGHAKDQIREKIEELQTGAQDSVQGEKDEAMKAAAAGTDAVKKSVRESMP